KGPLLRSFAKDVDLGLQIRRLDICDQAPFEARAEAFLERRDFLRRRVGREHELLPRFIECVERVKELLLRPFFSREELDVVEEKGVDLPVAVAKLLHTVVTDRRDQLVDEGIRRHVDNLRVRSRVAKLLPDRLNEVSFPEAGAAVDEERIE